MVREWSQQNNKIEGNCVLFKKIVEEESMNIVDIGQSDMHSNKCFMVAIKQKDY